MWHVVPYRILGVPLWAVENNSLYIHKYCNSRKDAQDYCDELNAK